MFQRKPWKEAIEEATGFPWAVLLISEKDWSTKELEKFKTPLLRARCDSAPVWSARAAMPSKSTSGWNPAKCCKPSRSAASY